MTSDKVKGIELAVVLFLITPSMLTAYFVNMTAVPFAVAAVSSIFSDLALLSLIFFLLWRNGEHPDQIGWTAACGAWREIGIGLLLYFPLNYGIFLLSSLLKAAGLPDDPELPPFLQITPDWMHILLALIFIAVIAVVEETVFRGYLITRFKQLGAGNTAAILLSSAFFAVGHGYQGSAGLTAVFCIGAVFGLIYSWRRSLIAPITLHFMVNFSSIVIAGLGAGAG